MGLFNSRIKNSLYSPIVLQCWHIVPGMLKALNFHHSMFSHVHFTDNPFVFLIKTGHWPSFSLCLKLYHDIAHYNSIQLGYFSINISDYLTALQVTDILTFNSSKTQWKVRSNRQNSMIMILTSDFYYSICFKF